MPATSNTLLFPHFNAMVSSCGDDEVLLSFFGDVSQLLVKSFAADTEARLKSDEESNRVNKRVYHIMVESLQNIRKHSDPIFEEDIEKEKIGGVMLYRNDEHYILQTCNAVSNDSLAEATKRLDQLHLLDNDGVKELYKERFRGAELSVKGGAGLGFIDMVRKTGHQITYDETRLNENSSCLTLTMTVSRN